MRKIVALLLVLIFMASSLAIFAKSAWSSKTEVTENSWTTKASMHTARAYLGVAVVNGKIYAIGGDVGDDIANVDTGTTRTSSVIATNEEYNPAADIWVLKKPMPTPRAGFGTAVYQDKIYCLGGWTYTTDYANTHANEAYNSVTDEWETKAPMPITGALVTANVVNGRIYVLFLEYDGPIEVYDIATDSWTNKTSPPNQIISLASAVVDNKLFFIARDIGPSGSGIRYFIQIYDTINDKWSVGAASPMYCSTAMAAATTNVNAPIRIYFFGETVTNVYDPLNDSWSVGASMPTPRLIAGSAVVDDIFYVVGGRSGQWGYITMEYPSAVTEQYIPFGYEAIPPVEPEPFPTVPVAVASGASAIAIAAGLLVHFKRRER